MAGRREQQDTPQEPGLRRPATTPDGRESQLISLAVDLAEKRLREGSATAAEVVHFLKLGSSRERLEQERLRHETALLEAKREGLESAQKIESLYEEAIAAMRSYSGQEPIHPDEYYDD